VPVFQIVRNSIKFYILVATLIIKLTSKTLPLLTNNFVVYISDYFFQINIKYKNNTSSFFTTDNNLVTFQSNNYFNQINISSLTRLNTFNFWIIVLTNVNKHYFMHNSCWNMQKLLNFFMLSYTSYVFLNYFSSIFCWH